MQWGRTMRSTPKDRDTEETIPKTVTATDENEENGDDMEQETYSNGGEGSLKSRESETIENENGLQASIDDLKDTINKLTDSLKRVDSKFEAQDKQLDFLYIRTKQLENTNKYLLNRVEILENQKKITNLKLDGVKENDNEDLMALVLNLVTAMGSACKRQDIDRVYRLGRKAANNGRPRSIVVCFNTVQSRHEFYNKRAALKGKKDWFGVWINEDVLEVTRRKKDDMRSVAALCRDKNVNCRLHSDGIIIGGRKYGINDLHTLPKGLTLGDAKFREYQPGSWYFQSEHVWPSNMHRTRVIVDKHDYETSEHAIQAIKATSNGDLVAAAAIKATLCPYEAKRIGDRVQTTLEWNKCQFDVLYEIMYEKVVQNPVIRKRLRDTGDCRLHEATRSETFGIGAGLHSRAARDGSWRGKDIVGQIWEKIRDDLSLTSEYVSP